MNEAVKAEVVKKALMKRAVLDSSQEWGFSDEDRLALASLIFTRDVTSFRDLTIPELRRYTEVLRATRWVIELLRQNRMKA